MQSRQPVCNEPSQGYNLQDPMGHWLERMGPRDLLDSTRGLDLQAQGGLWYFRHPLWESELLEAACCGQAWHIRLIMLGWALLASMVPSAHEPGMRSNAWLDFNATSNSTVVTDPQDVRCCPEVNRSMAGF